MLELVSLWVVCKVRRLGEVIREGAWIVKRGRLRIEFCRSLERRGDDVYEVEKERLGY